MTRGQMRILLRKRLQEKDGTAVQWEDAELNTLLDLGLQDLQKEILSTDSQAFVRIHTADREADKTRIPLPGAFIHELIVEVKDADTGRYSILDYKPATALVKADEDTVTGEETAYTILGKWLKVSPSVTTTVTDGYRFTFVPALTMDDDSVVPEVRLSLHESIVDRAKIKAYGETEEESKSADRSWEENRGTIPRFYRGRNQGKVAARPTIKPKGL